ncbi:MAG: PfkB family carbohydrate kinase [Acidimicrobiia bacterium]
MALRRCSWWQGRQGAPETSSATGVEAVVLSRGAEPTMAIIDGARMVATPPPVAPADHRGSGDAMTGALAVGLTCDLTGLTLLALGCAAGAASATRHGLATADAHLIAELAHRTQVRTSL